MVSCMHAHCRGQLWIATPPNAKHLPSYRQESPLNATSQFAVTWVSSHGCGGEEGGCKGNVAGSRWSPHCNFICIKYTVSSVSLTQKKMICCSNFLLCFPPKYIITIFFRQSSIFGALFMPFRHRELGKNRDSDKQKVVGSNDCLYFLLLSQCLLLS